MPIKLDVIFFSPFLGTNLSLARKQGCVYQSQKEQDMHS